MPARQPELNGHKHPVRSRVRPRPRDAQTPRSRSALGAAAEAVLHVGNLQTQTRGALDAQRQRVTGGVHKVRDALRTASELTRSEHEAVSRYLEQASQKADDVAQYIGSADLQRLRNDAERIARTHPGLYVGGAVALGILLGRLLKASGPLALSAAVGEDP